MYGAVKHLHIALAALTLGGFLLRAWWSVSESSRRDLPLVRILPHVLDTVFLVSGIALVVMASWSFASSGWLHAKIGGLLAYILLGTLAIRRGRTVAIRGTSAVLAVAVFVWIVGTALAKTPASWLALI